MISNVRFNSELIRRYDITGPRYTSYPTAVQFHEGFDETAFERHICASNDALIPVPLSLYVHLPFCQSLCYYCGCTKKITRRPEQGTAYLHMLSREIVLRGSQFDRDRPVQQLHFGGGTPTFFADIELEQLMAALGHAFSMDTSAEREFAIEIDPRTVDVERLSNLAGMGFNRISMGVQDLDPQVQQAVNRVQDPVATMALVDAAREQGFNSVSIDLIYGLPLQTPQRFERTLDTVLDARPNRLAVYSYAHLPGLFRSQRMIREADLPDAASKLELLKLTVKKLNDAGYLYIGMDHFALPDDELSQARESGQLQRNFQGYSTRADHDLIGLGVSAISKVGDCYAQNLKEIPRWSQALANNELPVWRGISLEFEDRLRRVIIEAIMCHGELVFADFENRFLIDFSEYFAPEMHRLQQMADDGLVEIDDAGMRITAEGRLLTRVVAMVFDEYFPPSRPDETRQSPSLSSARVRLPPAFSRII